MSPPSPAGILKGSIIQAVVNTVINGVINYFMIRGKDLHAVTADSITSGGGDTVVGHAVLTAVILAVIFTVLGFKSHRAHLPGVTWGEVARLAAKNAVFALGAVIVIGVLWQKVFPDLTVGTFTAASIAGLIAGAVSGITNQATLTTLLGRVAGR